MGTNNGNEQKLYTFGQVSLEVKSLKGIYVLLHSFWLS